MYIYIYNIYIYIYDIYIKHHIHITSKVQYYIYILCYIYHIIYYICIYYIYLYCSILSTVSTNNEMSGQHQHKAQSCLAKHTGPRI